MKDKARCEQGIHRGDHVRVLQRSRALHCSTGTISLYILTVLLTDLFYKKIEHETYFDSSLRLPVVDNIMSRRLAATYGTVFDSAKCKLF
jgi:hypothetical protein